MQQNKNCLNRNRPCSLFEFNSVSLKVVINLARSLLDYAVRRPHLQFCFGKREKN